MSKYLQRRHWEDVLTLGTAPDQEKIAHDRRKYQHSAVSERSSACSKDNLIQIVLFQGMYNNFYMNIVKFFDFTDIREQERYRHNPNPTSTELEFDMKMTSQTTTPTTQQ